VRVIAGFPTRSIERFGSTGFVHSRLARGEAQVSVVELDGAIGGHEAVTRQLLVVLAGHVAVAANDGSAELRPRAAVVWEQGEWHETRSLEPSLLLIVEGDFESFGETGDE
jgi:mannose-6-phosphate isomerase-like protein (cupin superfamily)